MESQDNKRWSGIIINEKNVLRDFVNHFASDLEEMLEEPSSTALLLYLLPGTNTFKRYRGELDIYKTKLGHALSYTGPVIFDLLKLGGWGYLLS